MLKMIEHMLTLEVFTPNPIPIDSAAGVKLEQMQEGMQIMFIINKKMSHL